MLKAYRLQDSRLISLKPDAEADTEGQWLAEAQWIELVKPKPEELVLVKPFCKVPLPKMRELDELESGSHHQDFDQGYQLNRCRPWSAKRRLVVPGRRRRARADGAVTRSGAAGDVPFRILITVTLRRGQHLTQIYPIR